jgi:hypothetical protein
MVFLGSLTAAHRNYMGVRSVPIAALHDALFNVSFGVNRRSESYYQWLLTTLNSQRICLALIGADRRFSLFIKSDYPARKRDSPGRHF